MVASGSEAYDTAGITAAFGTVTALYHRRTTGCGQWLDVSVQEATSNLADWSVPLYSMVGFYSHREGAAKREGSKPGGSTNIHPDHRVGRLGGLAVVAALLRRERDGHGAHVEVAQFEALVQGKPRPRHGPAAGQR